MKVLNHLQLQIGASEEYTFVVKTRDDTGNNSTGTTITYTAPEPPDNVSNLVRRSFYPGNLALSWSDPDEDFDHILITLGSNSWQIEPDIESFWIAGQGTNLKDFNIKVISFNGAASQRQLETITTAGDFGQVNYVLRNTRYRESVNSIESVYSRFSYSLNTEASLRIGYFSDLAHIRITDLDGDLTPSQLSTIAGNNFNVYYSDSLELSNTGFFGSATSAGTQQRIASNFLSNDFVNIYSNNVLVIHD